MKRKLLAVFTAVVALVCLGCTWALAACKHDSEEPPVDNETSGPEAGVYYYDAGAEAEYLLTLQEGRLFDLQIDGTEKSGKYKLEGEYLTLSVTQGETLSATYRNDAINLAYGNNTYRFLRKTEYTVHYVTNGAPAMVDAKVINGKTLTKPADPENGDLVFVGWYTDGDFRNLFYFNQPITGETTLYARFVEQLDPEFEVNFDVAHTGGEALPATTTVGHKLFNLPEPEWEGHTFVGWWTSDYHSSKKLTAQYTDQDINENTTLYAVWQSVAPAVSVTEKGVSWTGVGSNLYQVEITGPDVSVIEEVGTLSYAFDFASAGGGDYIVKVSANGVTATAYYQNKGLARVSVFAVEGDTLLFNAVPNAEKYLLTVDCGTPTHSHVDVDLGTTRSFSFDECDMNNGAITFVVKAQAEGYVTSMSEEFRVDRTLGSVDGIAVDADTDVVSWNAVDHATSYVVTLVSGEKEVFSGNVGSARTFDLKTYDKGNYTVKVTPVALGWNSPAAAETTYNKVRIATPVGLYLAEADTLKWNAVNGATGYEVTFNGNTYKADENSFEIKSEYYDGSQTSYKFTVHALGATQAETSLWSEAFTVRNGELGEINYEAGKVVWDAVFGVSTFAVKVNDGEPTVVSVNYCSVTFTQSGVNTVSVCAVDANGNTFGEWKSTEVTVYKVSFDSQDGAEVDAVYLTDGDVLSLPDATRYGYKFCGWTTAPKGEGNAYPNGAPYTEKVDRTLYAVWQANTYFVGFYVNGGSDDEFEPMWVTFGEYGTFPVPTPNDVSKAFRGWYYGPNPNVDVQYTDQTGELINPFNYAGSVFLWAVWEDIFKFEDYQNGVKVSAANGVKYVTEITVPVEVDGKRVLLVDNFQGCSTLVTINLPDTIEDVTLGTNAFAFQNCSALQNINIYDSKVNTTAKYFSVDGVLFYYNAEASGRTELKYYPYARTQTEYTVPSKVEGFHGESHAVDTIVQGAFRAPGYNISKLDTINIPATVALVEEQSFFNFYSLNHVNFLSVQGDDAAAKSLDLRLNAFGDPDTSLSVAQIKTLTLPGNLTNNPREALQSLSWLERVDVIKDGGAYSSIDGLLVKQGEYGTELVSYPRGRSRNEDTFILPDGITAIGDYAVFNKWDNTSVIVTPRFTDIVIPAGIRYIGVSAFEGNNFTTLTFEGTKNDLDLRIETRAFYPAYSNNSKYDSEELVLPENLVYIGAYAFGFSRTTASKLNTVVIRTTGRESVDFAANAFNTVSLNGAFVEVVRLGAGVPAISGLTGVFGTRLREIYVEEGNENYWSDDRGILYNKEQTELLFFPEDWEGDYAIPEQMTTVAGGLFANRTGLSGIVVHGGVKSIGDQAFKGCTGLTSVTFEAGTEALTIGASAFEGCDSLEVVTLPDRLTSIGNGAFKSCVELAEITIPKGVETLALASGGALQVFDGCTKLAEIKVDPQNTHYTAEGGILYTVREVKLAVDSATTTFVPDKLLYCPQGFKGEATVSGYIRTSAPSAIYKVSDLTKITFEDAKTTYNVQGEKESDAISLASETFNGAGKLETIKLPNGLDKMVANLFGMSRISGQYIQATTLEVPNTVASIERSALWGLAYLETLTFEKGGTVGLRIEDGLKGTNTPPSYSGTLAQSSHLTSIEFPERLTYLGTYAFASGTGSITTYITSVTFAEKAPLGLEIADNAFAGCAKIVATELVLPEGLTKIGASGLSGYTKLTTVTLPSTLEEIGQSAFAIIKLSGELVIPASVKIIGASAFSGTQYTALTFKDESKLESIGDNAFYSCSALQEVKFGTFENEFTMGNNVFSGCTSLTSIELPTMLREIGSLGSNLGNLTSITFDATSTSHLEKIGNKAFADTGITAFAFPETVATLELGEELFSGCDALTTIHISSTIASFTNVFKGCGGLTKITVAEENPYFVEGENNQPFINNKKDGSLAFAYGAITGALTITSESVAGSAYMNQSEITSITFADNVKVIGANAFQNCINLQTVTFAGGSVLTDIGAYAFDGCLKLDSVNFTNASMLVTVGDYAFRNTAVKEVTLGTAVTYLGTYAFQNTPVENVDFSKSTRLTALQARLFDGCTKLKTVAFPASLTFVGAYVFNNCVSLGGDEGTLDLSNTKLGYIGSAVDKEPALSSNSASHLFENCTSLKKVILPLSLKKLGGYVFKGCTNLQTVEGLNNVTQFSNYAFQDSGIQRITLPSAATFGSYLFDNCTIQSIDLSDLTLKSLPDYMFRNCTSLTEVKLPTGLTHIGKYTFQNCTALESIDLTSLALLERFSTGAAANVTATVDSYVFDGCTSLKEVKLPANFIQIGGYAFRNCESLTSFDFTGITVIGRNAFNGSGLTSVTVPNKVTLIGLGAFSNCASLTTAVFENGTAALTLTNGSSATSATSLGIFAGSALQNVTFGNRVKTIAGYMFQGCTALKEVTLPETVTSLGTYAFASSALQKITLSTKITSLGTYAFASTAIEEIDLSALNVKALGNYMFQNCANLKTVKLPETTSLTHLGTYTFQNCTSLESIDISKTGVVNFRSSSTSAVTKSTTCYLFDGCVNLKEVIQKEGGQIAEIAGYAFRNCESLTSFDFSKVTILGYGSFRNAGLSGTVSLPTSLKNMYNYDDTKEYPFTGCSKITAFEFQNGNAAYFAVDGALISLSGALVALPGGATVENGLLDLNLYEGVTLVPYLFANVTNVKKVILPNGLTEIPDYLFYQSSVEEVVLPDGLTTIGKAAFQYSAIKSVTIPASVTSIGASAFAFTEQLASVVFEDAANGTAQALALTAGSTGTPTETSNGVFYRSAFTSIELPARLSVIPASAFRETNLSSVTIPEGVTAINAYAFAGTKLTVFEIPSSVATIGNNAYANTQITEVTIPATVTSLGMYVFGTGETLTKLTVAEGAEEIGNSAFRGSSALQTIELPSTLTKIGTYAFSGTAITSFTVPEGITAIPNDLFEGCASLASVTFHNGVTSIGVSTFKDCVSLKSITIPESVTSIGSTAFQNCPLLETIVIPGKVSAIGKGTFNGCTSLKSIVVPESVTTIDKEAFIGLTESTTVNFAASLYAVVSNCGIDWILNNTAKCVYGYVPANEG